MLMFASRWKFIINIKTIKTNLTTIRAAHMWIIGIIFLQHLYWLNRHLHEQWNETCGIKRKCQRNVRIAPLMCQVPQGLMNSKEQRSTTRTCIHTCLPDLVNETSHCLMKSLDFLRRFLFFLFRNHISLSISTINRISSGVEVGLSTSDFYNW